MVPVPKEPTPKKDEHPGRVARAKAANVSPSTQAKVEWIANQNPEPIPRPGATRENDHRGGLAVRFTG